MNLLTGKFSESVVYERGKILQNKMCAFRYCNKVSLIALQNYASIKCETDSFPPPIFVIHGYYAYCFVLHRV